MRHFLWKNLSLWALLAVMLLGLWLHQWHIGLVPMGTYSDEASIGLNASMIERYQTDEFGQPWPAYFEAFGEYKNPLYIYTTAGILHYVPLSDVSLRGVSLLFFGVALPFWALLARHAFRSPWTAVWTTAVFACIPWIFTLSRVAFEAISYVTLYVISLYCVVRFFAKDKSSFWGALLLGAVTGLSWYAYSTARLLVPLMLVSLVLAFFGRARWRSWFGLALGLGALMVPAVLLLIYQPQILTGRFSTLSYLYDPSLTTWDVVRQFLSNYAGYFAPDFQLINGDLNLRHHTGFGGMSYYVVYIGMWLGVARYIWSLWHKKIKRTDLTTFFFLELLFAPVAASLTEANHAIRVITMVAPLVYFAGYGLEWFRMSSRTLWICILGIASVVLSLEARAFMDYSMSIYPHISVRSFMTFGIQEAVQKVAARGDTVLVVEPSMPEATVISNYYSLMAGNKISVTSLEDREVENVMTLPHCVLRKRKPYQQIQNTVSADGTESIPLDVRSSLSLICYPGTQHANQ